MTHIKFYFWLFLLQNIFVVNYSCFSQSDRQDVFGSWVVLSGSHKIAEKWSIPTVGILRHYEYFDEYEFGFFRSGATYTHKDALNFTLGLAYLELQGYEENIDTQSNKQYWLYQEVTLKSKLPYSFITNRIRLENRWIERLHETDFNLRLRHRIQFKVPVYHKKLYTKVFNELFLNLNEEQAFNQNRLFVGLGTSLSKDVLLETGYLKNHFTIKHYDRFRMALIFKTDLRKKAGNQK